MITEAAKRCRAQQSSPALGHHHPLTSHEEHSLSSNHGHESSFISLCPYPVPPTSIAFTPLGRYSIGKICPSPSAAFIPAVGESKRAKSCITGCLPAMTPSLLPCNLHINTKLPAHTLALIAITASVGPTPLHSRTREWAKANRCRLTRCGIC